jgi:hypothetical protein
MTDEVILAKAEIIERCLRRIAEEYDYRELDLAIVENILLERLADFRELVALALRLDL